MAEEDEKPDKATIKKYETLGQVIQDNAEGLARLEEEIPAKERREKEGREK